MHVKKTDIGKIISLTIFSIIVGLICTLFVLQYDPKIKEFLEKQVVNLFEKSITCTMQAKLKNVNFFSPTLEFSDVTVASKNDPAWKWHSKIFTLSFSWFEFFLYGVINLHVLLENADAYTTMQQQYPAIIDHIKEIIAGMPKDIPIALKSIMFKKTILNIADDEANVQCILGWSGESKVIDSSFKSHIHIFDSSLTVKERSLYTNLNGTVECYIPSNKQEDSIVVRTNCSLSLSHLGNNKNCFFTGYFIKDHGLFTLQSTNGGLVLGPLRISESAGTFIGEVRGNVPIAYVTNLLCNRCEENIVSGRGAFAAKLYFTTPYRLFGSLSLQDISYNNNIISPLSKISFKRQNQVWNGHFLTQVLPEGTLEGTWRYDENITAATLSFSNKKTVLNSFLEPWCIESNKLSCAFSYEPNDGLITNYNLTLSQPKLHTDIVCMGTATIDNVYNCFIHGKLNNNSYKFDSKLFPNIRLKHFHYCDQEGNSLAEINSFNDDCTKLKGTIGFPFIRHLINKMSDFDLQGQGFINFWCVQHPDRLALKMELDDGIIRLPHTYNFITKVGARATIDIPTKKITVDYLNCMLHKGVVRSTNAVINFSQDYIPTYLNIPLLFDSCLINNKDDLFSVVSGDLLFTKNKDGVTHINGALILDRTQLKEGVFSDLLKGDLFSPNRQLLGTYGDSVECDLMLTTQSPIRFNSSFFETTARVNLGIKQHLKQPDITGSIELLSGTINFPYKPLYITNAQFHFLSHQPYDPTIELTAKNRIKQYAIILTVHGSLQQPTIRLESAPPLSEEQIIALLLAGSEEESLSIVAPALVMQNIKNLIFSSQTFTTLDSYVKKVFNPFKNIHLVPSFIDQSGRGGLRAAIEIDINERWRALIQKNFSLSEDTRLEVDYFLSDDICFRAIRDEHRDVSGEMEMRWKF